LEEIMQNAVIVDAVRTPLGKRNGKLKDVHPVDLAAHTLRALVARNDAGAAIATALLFGGLAAGGSFLSTAGIATDLVPIVQALVVLGVVLPPALLQLRASRRGTPEVVLA